MTRLHALILILGIIVIFLVVFKSWPHTSQAPQPQGPYLILKGQHINLLLAQTSAERMQGLSNHPPLPDNTGMLFVFNEPASGPFWMKEMLFALDMIWFQGQTVVAISRNIPPPAATNGEPQVVEPYTTYTHVLELAGGWSDQHQLTVGEVAEFHL